MLKKLFPLFIYFNVRLLVNCDKINCNNETTLDEIHLHLATKTPYRFVENLDVKPLTYEGIVENSFRSYQHYLVNNCYHLNYKQDVSQPKFGVLFVMAHVTRNGKTSGE